MKNINYHREGKKMFKDLSVEIKMDSFLNQKHLKAFGVPGMAQWLMNPTRNKK